ncbi:nuclear transport factor 2 family protein [Pseudoduganella namucuonensis]|nr:nuclear transport factor 2 family protein [Pseudoduganella namucuonensis]
MQGEGMDRHEEMTQRIARLEDRLGRLEDIEEIQRLQRMYGYYIDNRLWPEMAALFADEGAAMEIGRRGRYTGKEHILPFLREVLGQGRDGLARNEFINHMQLQGVVTVDHSRQRAQGRWRALIQGSPPPGGTAMLWAEGVYENTYVRENGVWKIALLWWVPTFYVSHPGYESVSFASGPQSDSLPPQAPSVPPVAALGRSFPPFHYCHPVTGEEVVRVTSEP